MGSKRAFDGHETFQLPYKYSKQFTSDEKLISFVDEKLAPIACTLPGIETTYKLNISVGHNGNRPPRLVDPFEVKSIQEVHNVADRVLMDDFQFPCVTDSYGDDDAWCKKIQRSFLPDYYFDSGSPRRALVKVDDALSSFLDRYPRKQVPVGANHQADLPKRESPKPISRHGGALTSDQVLITDENKILMGTCVIPMPASSLPAQSSLPAGVGRKDCDCVDKASVRCVKQHVKEARDKLLKALGEDTFRDLGFLDMGEEGANKWSEEEEQVFHEIIFSNPASVGKDFWSCLLEAFSTRSMKDIVSYYFNVFMLRKRAAQNRSRFLDIDSDDDEWHPDRGNSYDLDFAGEEDDNYSSDEDDTSSADDDEKESPQLNIKFPHKDNDFIPVSQDGSCSSFEYQSSIDDSSPTKTGVPTKETNRLKNNYSYVSSDQTGPDNGLNPGYLVASSHFRQWDQGSSARHDHLLPTQNMIEEIFGLGSWDNKPNHD